MADRGFIVEAGVHPVTALYVELDEVDMYVDLAEEVILSGVLEFTLKNYVDAVLASVSPDRQWHPQTVAGPNGGFLFLKHVKLAHRVQ